MGLGWASPDPGFGLAIEMLGGDPGAERNIAVISQGLSGKGFTPEDAPPSLNHIQPRRSDRNEGVLDAGMGFQPLPDRPTGMTGEVVGNQVEVSRRIRPVQRLQQLQITARIACARRLRQRLPIADAQRSIHPDFGWSAVVIQGHLDAMPIG